ncbi:MAG: [Spirochaetia bacterium]|nr:[FeFe] hydrogenase H-cluster maturation GTPase HydF [Spirochaetia bacterium]MBQ3648179.1 [FeFe] hydrogenase H-cluster maturation GTPase HydF [Spirochaetia bacterium]
MSLNDTPSGERLHIALFGRRNAGKSSLINAITGQDLAVVSDIKGTTTDPVSKAMELLPLGPVVMIDTPGLDDSGTLGDLRVKKAYQVLNKSDIALLVVDSAEGFKNEDQLILDRIKAKNIPYIIVYNKCDLLPEPGKSDDHTIFVSSTAKTNINELKELIAHSVKPEGEIKRVVGDLIKEDDIIVLVVPIDKAAPKGRLILPQQQTIRDILDSQATAVVCQNTTLEKTLKNLGKKPVMVITDSQVFDQVSKIVPADIPLTSFSILFARYKGNLALAVQGVASLKNLKDGDTVLIAEGCTHHRQCNDIGSVKIPNWILKNTGKKINFEFSSGTEFPAELSKYALVVHCGGCMLNEREMKFRLRCAQDEGVPITNYGILIAYVTGILKRSVALFPDIAALLD